LVQGAVRAMVVKVRHVLVQHSREMAAVNDQYPVQQFPAGSSNGTVNFVIRGAGMIAGLLPG